MKTLFTLKKMISAISKNIFALSTFSLMLFYSQNVNSQCIDSSLIDNDLRCPYEIVEPLCGCDGFTYQNLCELQKAGITSYTPGACPTFAECIDSTIIKLY
jgi:hypothetical protein